jgi:hypothetical protein
MSQDVVGYERTYPLYRTFRIRCTTLDKIKTRSTKYGQSVDSIIEEMLTELEQKEKESKK